MLLVDADNDELPGGVTSTERVGSDRGTENRGTRARDEHVTRRKHHIRLRRRRLAHARLNDEAAPDVARC